MYASSPKMLVIDTKAVSNFVTTPNSPLLGINNFYTPKSQTKNQQHHFKSNPISRYSSQQDLQIYSKRKFINLNNEMNNSPKSEQQLTFKKYSFIPRKSNNTDEKQPNIIRPGLLKRKSTMTVVGNNFSYFKSPAFQTKNVKYLKQTHSTSSTDNLGCGPRSEKSIPSFLKNGFLSRRRNADIYHSRNKETDQFPTQLQLTIDNFQIIEKLGEGKFGSVFMAVEKYTGFIVALKIVQKKKVLKQNFLTQFIREIKIQNYLQHPNIAKIYGFFHDQHYFYSILQFGQGGQLYDIVKHGNPLSQEATSFIIGNLLDAVSYIHEKKILHRDIKPENIVLVHGNVKLCDFGWAVYKKGELRSTFCGTPLYLSPELLNGEKYDEKVDLWAIGILAFELHLSSSPFNIQSQQDLLKIITNDIQYPKDYHASKNFKEFIGAVLKKDPKERLQAKQLLQLKFIKRYKDLETCGELCQ